MKKTIFCSAVAAAMLIPVAGCVRELEKDNTLKEVKNTAPVTPVKNARLSLVFLGPKEFKAGQAAKISIALRNDGRNTVRLPDWRVDEAANVKLYCQPWLPGTDAPDENLWLSLEGESAPGSRRFNMDLYPGNQAVVHRELAFVKDLVISAGAQRRYFFKAELNLESAKASTDVYSVIITGK